MSFEYFIGGRYLRTRKKQTFISLISMLSIVGVTVGVMTLIVVIAVMSGFESDLKSRILGIESHIVLKRQPGPFTDYRQVRAYVEKVDGVEAATPLIYSQVMLRSRSGVSGAVLRGIDPDSADTVIRKLDSSPLRRAEGDTDPVDPEPGIILGRELAAGLGVLTGDTIYLISPRGMISPIGHLPAMKRFTLAGTFATGVYDYDGAFAYIHLKDAQKILRLGDTVTAIEVRVGDIYAARKVAEAIIAGLDAPYQATDWMQTNKSLFSALKLEKAVMFVILTLIVLVAAFNIASTLIMMVMEKTKDIAILKTMGATNGSVRKIFVAKGMAIGAIGTFLGLGLGLSLCAMLQRYKFVELPDDMYYITTLPVRVEALDVALIAAAAIAICFVATLYPAQQASKLNPIEAIRYG
jgi:lipoprotein-releasing system permease protein